MTPTTQPVPYSDRLDAATQQDCEEDIATILSDRCNPLRTDSHVSEETAAELGRTILCVVLARFRPDLFEGAK